MAISTSTTSLRMPSSSRDPAQRGEPEGARRQSPDFAGASKKDPF
jgi:hypothetical protein